MKLYIKWSKLNDTQRKQILSFYQKEIEEKTLFEHNLNQQRFLISAATGNFVPQKDF